MANVGGDTLFPLPEEEAAGLCRRFGLALGNAAMYGMEHAVTVASQTAAFDCLVSLLDLYGEIEWAMCDDGLLLNGKPVDVSKGMAQTLADQMRRGSLQQFAFCPPPDRREFSNFMAILSAEPGTALIADGVDAALVKAGFRSIRVDKAVYARVGSRTVGKVAGTAAGTAKVPGMEKGIPLMAGAKLQPSAGKTKGEGEGKGRVFDLDSELLEADPGEVADGFAVAAVGGLDVTAQAVHYLEQRNESRRQHAAMVDRVRGCAGDAGRLEMLRRQLLSSGFAPADWESLLEESGVQDAFTIRTSDLPIKKLIHNLEQLAAQRSLGGGDPQSMNHALKAIGKEVDSLIRSTQGQVTTLAQRVDADRGTVAEMERKARASGIGLQLSREELLKSMAEINQELVQPLTTSSALLQLLKSGKVGAISDAQRDLLQTVSDGMDRLEKLFVYLHRISGVPSDLSPDHALLSDVYNGR